MEVGALVGHVMRDVDRADLVMVIRATVLPNEDSRDPHLLPYVIAVGNSNDLETVEQRAAQLLKALRGIVERLEDDALVGDRQRDRRVLGQTPQEQVRGVEVPIPLQPVCELQHEHTRN